MASFKRSVSVILPKTMYSELPKKVQLEKSYSMEELLKVDSFGVYEELTKEHTTKMKGSKFNRTNSMRQKLRRDRGAKRIKRKRHATVYTRQSSQYAKLNRQPSLSTKLNACKLYEDMNKIPDLNNNNIYQELVTTSKECSSTAVESSEPIYWNFQVDEYTSSPSYCRTETQNCPTLPPARQRRTNYTELKKTGKKSNDNSYEEVHIYEELDSTFYYKT